MGFSLNKVVPWGRSFAEYVAMFELGESDLQRSMLGCGDGPAGFNAELTERGGRVVSCDPLYVCSPAQIQERIAATYDQVMAQVAANQKDFVWQRIPSPAALGRIRLAAMQSFLQDFEGGKRAGRYIAAALPALPFADDAFALALSSHLLFLYSEQLSAEFHLQALREMLRVAGEVRVFPLLTLAGQPSPHLQMVVGQLAAGGFQVEVRSVPYEFQRGGNEMLVVRNPAGGDAEC